MGKKEEIENSVREDIVRRKKHNKKNEYNSDMKALEKLQKDYDDLIDLAIEDESDNKRFNDAKKQREKIDEEIEKFKLKYAND